jgi:hypothetical protein
MIEPSVAGGRRHPLTVEIQASQPGRAREGLAILGTAFICALQDVLAKT